MTPLNNMTGARAALIAAREGRNPRRGEPSQCRGCSPQHVPTPPLPLFDNLVDPPDFFVIFPRRERVPRNLETLDVLLATVPTLVPGLDVVATAVENLDSAGDLDQTEPFPSEMVLRPGVGKTRRSSYCARSCKGRRMVPTPSREDVADDRVERRTRRPPLGQSQDGMNRATQLEVRPVWREQRGRELVPGELDAEERRDVPEAPLGLDVGG